MPTIAKKKAPRRKKHPPLPPSSNVTTIGDREYIIAPLAEYEEWYEDLVLGTLVAQRMREPHDIVPFAEIEAKLDKKKKGK